MEIIENMKTVLAHRRGEIELEQVWPKARRHEGRSEARMARLNARSRNGSKVAGCPTQPQALA